MSSWRCAAANGDVDDSSIGSERDPILQAERADLDGQIVQLEQQLAALRREKAARQEAVFLLALARVIPAGVVFSAADVIARAALDRELAEAIGRRTARQLGHYLRSLAERPASSRGRPETLGHDLKLQPDARVVLCRADDRNNRGCIWSIAITP